MIDDLYREYAPKMVFDRYFPTWKLSSQSFAVNLTGVILKSVVFLCKEITGIFSQVLYLEQFNQMRRKLLQITELLQEELLCTFSMRCRYYFIIDSFTLAVGKFERTRYCHYFCSYGADYGKYLSKRKIILVRRFTGYPGRFHNRL